MSAFGTQGADDFGQSSLTRPREFLAVHGRWNRPVTPVVAGAGFGKTTLLSQAVAENQVARIGTDIVLRLEAADNRASRLASRVLGALGVAVPRFADTERARAPRFAQPDIGIARLAVDGAAHVLREDDMRFTDAEIGEFARLRGVAPEFVGAAQGWPALAELLARAPGITTDEYVWEQIISPLGDAVRARLVELAAPRSPQYTGLSRHGRSSRG